MYDIVIALVEHPKTDLTETLKCKPSLKDLQKELVTNNTKIKKVKMLYKNR